MKGDFHIHSVYSDGVLTVDEILEEASKKLNFLAVTDHDAIGGAIEAYQKASKYNLHLILGVEISTYYNDESVHILGYFKSLDDLKGIEDFLSHQRDLRAKRCIEISKRLKKYFNIDLDVSNLLKKSSITRGSIASEMIKQGVPYTHKEIFEKFLGEDSPAYIPSSKVPTDFAIELLRQNNATIVLAHPVRFKKNNPQDIIDLGVDGLEALYSINTEEDNIKYRELAQKNNLFITAGSDFHHYDDFQHGDIGCVYLENEELETFINKVRG